MPRRRRVARAAVALLGLVVLAGGCATPLQRGEGPSPSPLEVYRALLGRNQGLQSVRAVAEVGVAFAGREVSLPGVLNLDAFGGFRLDLLDPLDRPLAILFIEEGRIVQYRPAQRQAASLGVFPRECGGVGPADWVGAVVASSLGPVAGERLGLRAHWRGERSLERVRDGELRQSVRYRVEGGEPLARLVSWYCGDEVVMQARLRDWLAGPGWRLPARIEIGYPKAGLSVTVELREIEGNPPASGQSLRPDIGGDVRWTSWNLPR